MGVYSGLLHRRGSVGVGIAAVPLAVTGLAISATDAAFVLALELQLLLLL